MKAHSKCRMRSFPFESEAETSHHVPRCRILRLVDADERPKAKLFEPVADPSAPGLRSESETSIPLTEPPAHLDGRKDLWEERRNRQTRPACEFSGVGNHNRRYGDAWIPVALDRALKEGLCLVSRPTSTERISPERLLGMQRSEIIEIVHRERAQYKSIGQQCRPPHVGSLRRFTPPNAETER